MFDLALSRADHDLMFVPVQGQPFATVRYSILPIEGADRVAQQIKITLLAFLGEWFLDINFGVPYLEEILVKNPRLTSIESILRSKIMDVPDVSRITFFSMEFDRYKRDLRVEFHCDTLFGVIKDSVRLNMASRVK